MTTLTAVFFQYMSHQTSSLTDSYRVGLSTLKEKKNNQERKYSIFSNA